MKKSTKIFIASLSVILVLFTFAFSKAQEDKIHIKNTYESYALVNEIISSEENLEQAEGILKVAEETFIEDPNIYLQKARLYEKMKNYEEAEKNILKIFEMRPDLENNTDVLKLYANIVFLKGDHQKAQEITNKLKELGGE